MGGRGGRSCVLPWEFENRLDIQQFGFLPPHAKPSLTSYGRPDWGVFNSSGRPVHSALTRSRAEVVFIGTKERACVAALAGGWVCRYALHACVSGGRRVCSNTSSV